MLKEDELISKKAEDIFNNFLEGEMKIKDEKVVNIEESKDKKSNRKKILSMVATLVIVFLGANVYAVTKGYNNIFFIIRRKKACQSYNSAFFCLISTIIYKILYALSTFN